jgi:hypothetical protein
MKIKDLKKKMISLFVFILLFSGNANADEGDFSFGVNFGQSIFASSKMDDFGSNALAYGAYFGFSPSDIIGLTLNFNYAPFSKNNNEANLFYSTLQVQVKSNYDTLVPFFGAGLGFYRSSIDTGFSDGSSTAFGINFGGGLDILVLDKFTIGFVGNYHGVFNQDVSGTASLSDFFDIMLRFGFKLFTATSSGW